MFAGIGGFLLRGERIFPTAGAGAGLGVCFLTLGSVPAAPGSRRCIPVACRGQSRGRVCPGGCVVVLDNEWFSPGPSGRGRAPWLVSQIGSVPGAREGVDRFPEDGSRVSPRGWGFALELPKKVIGLVPAWRGWRGFPGSSRKVKSRRLGFWGRLLRQLFLRFIPVCWAGVLLWA